MEKKLVNRELNILEQVDPIKWKQIKDFKFDDEDIILVGYVDEEQDCCFARVIRKMLETDEQFEKRCAIHEKFAKLAREHRYEEYKKLKLEFES